MGSGIAKIRAALAAIGALVFLLGSGSPARAVPVVTAANISVDGSGATGPAGTFAIGDEVVISWDNSPAGDDNTDVTGLSQVVFDVFGITSLTAGAVIAGVFSVTYFFQQGDGDFSGVTAGVTATNAGGSTGPVYGLQTFDIATTAPTVTSQNILVDVSGATGLGATFHPGDLVVISWDNSPTGDDNANVTDLSQVAFDVFGMPGMTSTTPDTLTAGVFSVSYVFQESDVDFTNVGAEVTVTNAAGTTGPVAGLQLIDFRSSPVSVPFLSPLGLAILSVLLGVRGHILLRRRSRSGCSAEKTENRIAVANKR